MHRTTKLNLGLLVALLLVNGEALGQVRPRGKADPLANTAKMTKAGQVIGTVTSVGVSNKTLRLKVTQTTRKLDAGQYRAMLQAKQEMARARFQRNPQQRARQLLQAQRKYAQAQARLYKVETKSQDVDLDAVDDVKVRLNEPPAQFDDKGNIVKLTKAQKAKLRREGPDPKLPGFAGSFSDLKEGQIVKVQLVRKKGRPRIRPGGRKVDQDAQLQLLADYQPKASVILILR